MLRVLLSFVGFHDPYHPGPVEGEELRGPILYLLGLREFDRVYLLTGQATADLAGATAAAIRNLMPSTEPRVIPVDIDDPINHVQIVAALRSAFRRIRQECPEADYSIATASGTPQMHASWLALATTGEIPARVLQTRPPRFVTTDRQAVEEVDLRALGWTGIMPAAESPPGQQSAEELAREELGIVGRHPSFLAAIGRASQFARHPATVLIEGETGTGKELVARYIHRLSGRAPGKLECVNCANLPKDLADSLLFGHRAGAFTGATRDQPGKFELADGGTLFLDEIGELPPEAQAKLLRVLEDGIVQPLGAPTGRRVDVRLIVATNRNLLEMVHAGTFREDLYYRVAVGVISLPPLRERRSDIPLLALAGMENINRRLGRPKRLTQAALDRLMHAEWPGNVRELMNSLACSTMLATGEVIDAADLLLATAAEPGGRDIPPDADDLPAGLPEPRVGFDMPAFLDRMRRRLFARALELARGSPAAAARLLGVSSQAVSNHLRRTQGPGAGQGAAV